jgi:hypothetical protein
MVARIVDSVPVWVPCPYCNDEASDGDDVDNGTHLVTIELC